MKEITGDLWTIMADYRVITTNGTVRRDGSAVMGRGVAYQAKSRYPQLPMLLGRRLQTFGNHVAPFPTLNLMTFPVKHAWYEEADRQLIRRSVEELFALLIPTMTFAMVRPGCGNGHLRWKDVKPLVAVLPDNVLIVNNEGA